MGQTCLSLTGLFDRLLELQSKHCWKFSPELEKAKIPYLVFKKEVITPKEREAPNPLSFTCH